VLGATVRPGLAMSCLRVGGRWRTQAASRGLPGVGARSDHEHHGRPDGRGGASEGVCGACRRERSCAVVPYRMNKIRRLAIPRQLRRTMFGIDVAAAIIRLHFAAMSMQASNTPPVTELTTVLEDVLTYGHGVNAAALSLGTGGRSDDRAAFAGRTHRTLHRRRGRPGGDGASMLASLTAWGALRAFGSSVAATFTVGWMR
jgi:hypothetical protein